MHNPTYTHKKRTPKNTHTHAHTNTHTHTRMRTQTQTHTLTHIATHTATRAHTGLHKHTHTLTLAGTHSHTSLSLCEISKAPNSHELFTPLCASFDILIMAGSVLPRQRRPPDRTPALICLLLGNITPCTTPAGPNNTEGINSAT